MHPRAQRRHNPPVNLPPHDSFAWYRCLIVRHALHSYNTAHTTAYPSSCTFAQINHHNPHHTTLITTPQALPPAQKKKRTMAEEEVKESLHPTNAAETEAAAAASEEGEPAGQEQASGKSRPEPGIQKFSLFPHALDAFWRASAINLAIFPFFPFFWSKHYNGIFYHASSG